VITVDGKALATFVCAPWVLGN